jgi:hypothetical protein
VHPSHALDAGSTPNQGRRVDGILQLLYSTQSTLGYQIGNLAQGLANNGMTDAQRAALPQSDPEYGMRVIGSKVQVAGWSCYSTLMVVLKFAMLFFYLRLTVCCPFSALPLSPFSRTTGLSTRKLT